MDKELVQEKGEEIMNTFTTDVARNEDDQMIFTNEPFDIIVTYDILETSYPEEGVKKEIHIIEIKRESDNSIISENEWYDLGIDVERLIGEIKYREMENKSIADFERDAYGESKRNKKIIKELFEGKKVREVILEVFDISKYWGIHEEGSDNWVGYDAGQNWIYSDAISRAYVFDTEDKAKEWLEQAKKSNAKIFQGNKVFTIKQFPGERI